SSRLSRNAYTSLSSLSVHPPDSLYAAVVIKYGGSQYTKSEPPKLDISSKSNERKSLSRNIKVFSCKFSTKSINLSRNLGLNDDLSFPNVILNPPLLL